jgi:hypothetical protein
MPGKGSMRLLMVISIAALFLVPVTLASGTEGIARNGVPVLSGTIKDSVGVPIPGAVVRIVLADMSDYDYAFADPSGHYSLNISFTGLSFLEAESPGYLKHRSAPFMIDPGVNMTYNVTLPDLPPEAVNVSGIVTFEEGGAAEGVAVRLGYDSMGNYYDYEEVTDDGGSFGMLVFAGMYSIRMSYHGFTVYEDVLDLTLGGSPYIISPEIPFVPALTTVVMGYVDDGASPLEGVFVVISDQSIELQNFGITNESGYYEIPFWAGDHIMITMMPGYDYYFSRIHVPDSGSMWVNITTKVVDKELSGTVLDPSGEPVEGINVQLSRPKVFPDQYSTVTDGEGKFLIDVSEGGGYLVVSGEDPFETGEYELYFKEIGPITNDVDLEIQLSPVVEQLMTSDIVFSDWEEFNVDAVMNLPINNTRYMRLFIDMFVGDMDQSLSDMEFGIFYDMMMADSDMQTAPFGTNTSDNLTIDGHFYDRTEQSIEFRDMVGGVDDLVSASVRIDAAYELNGTLPEMISHTLDINMTYDEPGSRTVGTASVPDGWIYYNHTSEHIAVEQVDGMLVLTPGKDPDIEDDITWEHIRLTFFVDSIEMGADLPEAFEGTISRFRVIVDDALPENVYNITWDMGDSNVLNSTVRYLDHAYMDDGVYTVNVTLTDAFGRIANCTGTVTVLNKAPSVAIVADRTNIGEGEATIVTVNATDVPADVLYVSWFSNGTYPDPVPLTNESMRYTIRSDFEGNRTVSVRVTDEDGGITEKSITVTIYNKDPIIDAELILPRPNNITYENETVMVHIVSAVDVDDLVYTIKVSRSDHRSKDLNVTVLGTGKYTITLTADDQDGGIATLSWTIEVAMNVSLDHDGDGIPYVWEKAHGLDDYKKSDGASDPDGDGFTNYEEYLKGSDPFNENDPVEQKKDSGLLVLIILAVIVLIIVIIVVLVVQNRMKERIEE